MKVLFSVMSYGLRITLKKKKIGGTNCHSCSPLTNFINTYIIFKQKHLNVPLNSGENATFDVRPNTNKSEVAHSHMSTYISSHFLCLVTHQAFPRGSDGFDSQKALCSPGLTPWMLLPWLSIQQHHTGQPLYTGQILTQLSTQKIQTTDIDVWYFLTRWWLSTHLKKISFSYGVEWILGFEHSVCQSLMCWQLDHRVTILGEEVTQPHGLWPLVTGGINLLEILEKIK